MQDCPNILKFRLQAERASKSKWALKPTNNDSNMFHLYILKVGVHFIWQHFKRLHKDNVLLLNDCVATHSSNTIVKFADDTTVIGQNTDGDETAYREEVENLTSWCQDNNLHLNVS